ncbi:hypothetical protein BU17DRAFT_61209 [Hysterangium stoloniferum]|nr:hypothetical protein BU17DRAFT_61209 [Hysterangium stoloniferum]
MNLFNNMVISAEDSSDQTPMPSECAFNFIHWVVLDIASLVVLVKWHFMTPFSNFVHPFILDETETDSLQLFVSTSSNQIIAHRVPESMINLPPMLAAHIKETFCPKLRNRLFIKQTASIIHIDSDVRDVRSRAIRFKYGERADRAEWRDNMEARGVIAQATTLAPSPNSQSHPSSIGSSASPAPVTARTSSSRLLALVPAPPPSFSRMDLGKEDPDRLARDSIIHDGVRSSVQVAIGRTPAVDEVNDSGEPSSVGHLDVKNQEVEETDEQQDIPLPTLPQRYMEAQGAIAQATTLAPSSNPQSHPSSIMSSLPPASPASITARASSSGLLALVTPPPSFSRIDLENKDQDRLARDFIIDDDVQSSVQAATGRAPTVDEGDDRGEAIQVGHSDVKNQEAEATKVIDGTGQVRSDGGVLVKQQDIPLPTLPQRYIIGNNKAHSGLFRIFINGIIKILNANIAPTQEDGPEFSDSNHPATPKKVLVDISIQTDHPTFAPSPSALGKRPIANFLDFMERAVPEQSQPPSDKYLHVMAFGTSETLPEMPPAVPCIHDVPCEVDSSFASTDATLVNIEEMDDQTVGAGSKSVPVEQAHSQEKVVEVKDLVADANMFMNYSGKYVGPSLTSDARFPAGRQTEEQRGTEIPQRVVLDKSETVDILGNDHVTGPTEEPSMTRTSMGSAETLTVSASDAVVYSDTAPQLKSDEDCVAVGGLAETMDVLVGNSVVPTSTSEANPSVIGETEVQHNFEMPSEVDLEQAHTQEQVVAIEDLVAATNMFMNCSRSSEIGIAPERYEPTPEETAVIQNMWATMNMCMNRSGSSSVDPSLPAGRETEEQSGVDEPVPEQAEAEPTTGDGKKKKKKKKKKAAVSNGEPGMDIPDNGEPHTLLQDVVVPPPSPPPPSPPPLAPEARCEVGKSDSMGSHVAERMGNHEDDAFTGRAKKGQMHGMFAKGITAPSEIVCTGCCRLLLQARGSRRQRFALFTKQHVVKVGEIHHLKLHHLKLCIGLAYETYLAFFGQVNSTDITTPYQLGRYRFLETIQLVYLKELTSLYITNINAPGSTYPTYIQHTKIFGLERLRIITLLFWY